MVASKVASIKQASVGASYPGLALESDTYVSVGVYG